MRYLLLSGAVVAAVGLYLLAGASADTTLFARHYPWLLALNATLAGLFAIMVVVQLFALARRYRAREFGTRLTLRLLGRFAVLAVVPGMIVYGVSVQFQLSSSFAHHEIVYSQRAMFGLLSIINWGFGIASPSHKASILPGHTWAIWS